MKQYPACLKMKLLDLVWYRNGDRRNGIAPLHPPRGYAPDKFMIYFKNQKHVTIDYHNQTSTLTSPCNQIDWNKSFIICLSVSGSYQLITFKIDFLIFIRRLFLPSQGRTCCLCQVSKYSISFVRIDLDLNKTIWKTDSISTKINRY